MRDTFQSHAIHDKALEAVAREVIMQLGIMPRGAGKTKWQRRAEQVVRKLHKQYATDLDKAFVLKDAVKLVKAVGSELADRESAATNVQRPSPTEGSQQQAQHESSKVSVGKPVSQPAVATQVRTGPSTSSVPEPSANVEKMELAVTDRLGGEQLPMALPVEEPKALLERPLVTLGAGLLMGFIIGACAVHYLIPPR